MKHAKLLLLFLCFQVMYGQDVHTEEEAIKQVISTLFDAMKNNDGEQLKTCFSDRAKLYSLIENEGKIMKAEGNLEEFAAQVSAPKKERWIEKAFNINVHVDGPLAQAWMDYSFYLEDKLIHCGVNNMTFIMYEGVWKIETIFDTRKEEGCIE